MAYNIKAPKRLDNNFSAEWLEEVVQHIREGWQQAHDGKPYERFESGYRQQGWMMYFNLTATQTDVDAFIKEVGYAPFCR